MLRQREFHIFLFFLLLFLVDWPLMAVPAQDGLLSAFRYLFLVWVGFIILLFLINRSIKIHEEENGEGGG